MSILQIRLMLSIMKLGLHSRRINLQNLHISRTILQLSAESKNEMVQSSLGSAVIRASHHGHERHLRRRECDGCCGLLALQVWEECFGYADRGCIVRDQFLVEDVQIDSLRLGEVEGSLDTRVDEDAVQIGVLRYDL